MTPLSITLWSISETWHLLASDCAESLSRLPSHDCGSCGLESLSHMSEFGIKRGKEHFDARFAAPDSQPLDTKLEYYQAQ